MEHGAAPSCAFASGEDEDLVLRLMQEFYPGEGLPFDADIAREALGELWRNPALGCVCLIYAGREVAGYAVLAFGFSLEFHGRDALIDELYIRPTYRGMGYGTGCIEWLEAFCVKEGIRAIHLEVDHDNERAQRLYNRIGYRDHDRHLLTKWLSGG
jgi:ribosomal protein S18 acetylase RimI-like enzyme